MSDYLACAAGCTIRDEHLTNCADDTCTGCLPKPAQFGCLCPKCWYRLVDAVTEWSVLEAKLDENDVLSPREPGVSRSPAGPRLPLPLTFLDADAVRSWLRSYTGDARSWVSTVTGARDAVQFSKAVEHAARTHLIAEKPRRLVRMRCPNPVHSDPAPLVVWMPPEYAGDSVSVQCAECGRTITDEEQWTAYRRTVDGWEGYRQQAIDVVAEIETRRKSVMTVMNEETA